VYHVLMQGVRHRDIYIDDEDYRTFVEILERLQKSKDGEERYRIYKRNPSPEKLDWDFFVL